MHFGCCLACQSCQVLGSLVLSLEMGILVLEELHRWSRCVKLGLQSGLFIRYLQHLYCSTIEIPGGKIHKACQEAGIRDMY